MRRAFVVLAALCLTGAGPPPARAEPSPAASAYLKEAIGILKANHLNTAKVDWPTIEAEAFRTADKAERSEQTYPAINHLIRRLGDPHSGLFPRQAFERLDAGQDPTTGAQKATETPSGLRLSNGAAFVSVPGIRGSGDRVKDYAAAGQRVLADLDRAKPCGWVVDLRANSGGNMGPMLQALSGLLGQDPYGYWVGPTGARRPWPNYGTGQTLQTGARPIAVLIGPSTNSSGEFTLMAFRGLPNVRIFGLPTNGYVSSNRIFPLSDGARLNVSTTWGEDRSGKVHTTAISPDEPAADSQAALDAALAWLNTKGCRH